MSDITQILQLKGAQLERIETGADDVTLHFSEVRLVQEMDGAFEDSLWRQAIDLVVKNAEVSGTLPDCPCELAGGDLSDNIYTYRDHAPLPINWRGQVGCKLRLSPDDTGVAIDGTSIVVEQIAHPVYLRHISKDGQD